MTESKRLYDTVIKNDYCIGCGACALVKDSPFKIEMDKYGKLVANAPYESLMTSQAKVLDVCPFSETAKNEDEISDIFYPELKKNDKIGRYLSCFAGYVKEVGFRDKGSSGGIAKWVGYTLLKEKKIDFFVQLESSTKNSERLFDYSIISNADDVLNGSKSAYYPTTLANIITEIKNNHGEFAITGVPCNIKALRLLSLKDDLLKSKLKYTIGIVCGGMKSANYAKLVGWELGIHPVNLAKIEYRRKYENRPANEKIYQVWSKDNKTKYRDVGQIYGTGYAAGFFKPNACDFCDDVLSETADISVGDAWLKQYVQDPKGTSLIVVRNKELFHLIKEANENEKIYLEEISSHDAASAQAGGLRHRREGLSIRIEKKQKQNKWVPPKRVFPNQFRISKKRKRIYNLREEIANKSHTAFVSALEKDNLKYFHRKMNPLIFKFGVVNFFELLPSLPRRIRLYINNKISK